jgi:hypothetical protein
VRASVVDKLYITAATEISKNPGKPTNPITGSTNAHTFSLQKNDATCHFLQENIMIGEVPRNERV